jgi:hypothetical protein
MSIGNLGSIGYNVEDLHEKLADFDQDWKR